MSTFRSNYKKGNFHELNRQVQWFLRMNLRQRKVEKYANWEENVEANKMGENVITFNNPKHNQKIKLCCSKMVKMIAHQFYKITKLDHGTCY